MIYRIGDRREPVILKLLLRIPPIGHVRHERTKKAAVTKALQEFIARREQKHLLELFGKLEWDVDHDYKAERSRK